MTAEIKIRRNWIKGMYILTIVVAGGFGLGILFAPEQTKSMSGWPGGDPVSFGITGSVYAAFALLSILGLRTPLKFAPVLLLQLFYKAIWFICVVAPLLISGKFPGYLIGTVIIYAVFVIGDIIAIPFGYLFKQKSV
jgi:hypothetical protein